MLRERDGVDPDDVIMDPDGARRRGLTSTVTFPNGNLAPGRIGHQEHVDRPERGRRGRRVSDDRTGARVPHREGGGGGDQERRRSRAGDVLVLMCRGPMGSGMEEIYQITSALKYLAFGKHVAVITDARFSGVSTGACIGHVTPEALAGGPLGKVREGDVIEIVIDRVKLEGRSTWWWNGSAEEGARELAARAAARRSRRRIPRLPDATRLWAALQDASGGTWGGCVFDVEAIGARLRGGLPAGAQLPSARGYHPAPQAISEVIGRGGRLR